MPTLTKLAGWTPRTDPTFDGLDIWPQLNGAAAEPRTIYIPLPKSAAVLHGEWKLIEREKGKSELFHIAADPCEKNDLAGERPEQVKRLQDILAELRRGDMTRMPNDLAGFDSEG